VCDDEIIRSQVRIENIADDADLEEVYDSERRLLYVACIRAHDQLLVTRSGPHPSFWMIWRTEVSPV
jgi:superfamily I DNA/RNA helicase